MNPLVSIQKTLEHILFDHRGIDRLCFPDGSIRLSSHRTEEGTNLKNCTIEYPSTSFFILGMSSSTRPSMIIYVFLTQKFTIENAKEVFELSQKLKCNHFMLLYRNVLTSAARKVFENALDYCIEKFEYQELIFDITQHRLFFPHRRLSRQEVQAIKAKIPDLQSLPKLLKSDPVCRFLGFEKNDVIEIRRPDSIAFRLVR